MLFPFSIFLLSPDIFTVYLAFTTLCCVILAWALQKITLRVFQLSNIFINVGSICVGIIVGVVMLGIWIYHNPPIL